MVSTLPYKGQKEMSEPLITQTQDDQGIVTLTMQDRKGNNALGVEFVEALFEELHKLSNNRDAKVCIVKGLEDVFCAGGDQEMLLDLADGNVAPTDIMLSRAMLEVPIPTIAAMEGHAVGGGLALGLCCDIVLMAKESRYGCSFMNMGFTPGMGTTRLLQYAVGEFIAAEMMYGGEFFRGSHFEKNSNINYILPRKKIMRKATQIARRIAEKPRFALELLKNDLSIPKRRAFEESRIHEAAMHQICFSEPETIKLIKENYAPALSRGDNNDAQ